ncbi:hypothetical protein [Pseudonocardia adelaidensis]|uniref:Uncharacterized protein n=1 Tax=Pseudonocardia adelaidensis TaxID=648754 RepID=A0ABP9N4X8_9PSEU
MTADAPDAAPAPGTRVRRTLRSPTTGHLVIAIAAVPVTVLVGNEAGGRPPGGSWLLDPVTPGVLLVIGQVLSCGRNWPPARATGDRPDAGRIARGLRRSGWTVGLVVCATFSVPHLQLAGSVPPWLWALFLLLVMAALLLEYRHAGWAHRRLDDADERGAVAEYRPLPPRVGRRLRSGLRVAAVCHVLFAGIAALLAVATITAETGGPTGGSATTAVQIGAAAVVVAVPLLHIRPLLLVGAAVVGDAVHVPALRRAGASFVRAGRATAVLAGFVVASVPAAPADPDVAVGRAALLAVVVGVGALQFTSVGSTRVGDFPRRWLRTSRAG